MIHSEMRNIHSHSMNRQITDMIQLVFVAEMASPSSCLWIVSPWISDIPVIDNQANQFITLETDWNRRKVILSEVLLKLMDKGTTVVIATRPDEHNTKIIEHLERMKEKGSTRLIVRLAENLHEKGILGDHYYLNGSMNLTYNGVFINEENVYYYTDRKIVSEHRVKYSARWGGL